MRKIVLPLIVAFSLLSCGSKKADPAEELLAKIEGFCTAGEYQTALDSIVILRDRYPRAIEARKRCLELWDQATLELTKTDIGETDAQLQEVLTKIDAERDIYTANMLRVKRDSLQARYEALCAIAKKIMMKSDNQ